MRVCPVMHYTRAVDMQVTYRCRDGRFTVPVAFAVVVQKLLHHVLHPHKPAGHCFIDQRRVRPAKERLLQYFKMNFYNVTVLSPVPASYGRTTNQQQMGRGQNCLESEVKISHFAPQRNCFSNNEETPVINHFKSKILKICKYCIMNAGWHSYDKLLELFEYLPKYKINTIVFNISN